MLEGANNNLIFHHLHSRASTVSSTLPAQMLDIHFGHTPCLFCKTYINQTLYFKILSKNILNQRA